MTRTRKSEHLSLDSPIFDGLRAHLCGTQAEQSAQAATRKAAKLEALIARPGTDGERAAAQHALDRLTK